MHRQKTMALGVAMLLAAEVAHAASRKTTTDVGAVALTGGVIEFLVEQDDSGKRAIVYVREKDVIDTVYMHASVATLKQIAKACEETAAELEKDQDPTPTPIPTPTPTK